MYPMPKSLFRSLSKILPTDFLKFKESLVNKDISLKKFSEDYQILQQRKNTLREVMKIPGYSREKIENVEAFSLENMDTFSGAVVGIEGNEKGAMLT